VADPINTGFDSEFGGPLKQFRDYLTSQGIKTNVISGVRDSRKQAQLYYNYIHHIGGQGLAAPPGSSLHERGLAADIQPANPADLPKIVALAKQFGIAAPYQAHGPRYDPYHFQLTNWQQAEATQAPNTPWGTIPDVPTQYASNVADASTSGGGGFKIPGTKINGSAPIPGALAETGPESSNAGGGAAKSGEPMDNRQIVFNRLVGAGISPQVALGAMWSLGGESGGALNTGSYNPKDPGGAVGFGQWTGGSGRRQALEALAKANGTPWTDINTQADHLINELTNKDYSTYQPGVFDALKGAQTSEEGARIWTSQFERPKVDNSNQRIKNGSAVGSLDDQGNFVPGSAKASTAVASEPTGPRDTTASAPLPGQAAADNQSLFGRFTQGPIDPATGKPTPGAVPPMAQIADAILNNRENMLKKVDAAGPERTALSDMPAPVARNVSPMGGAMLPNVAQTYGQTLNSFTRPLIFNDMPPQAPQMAPAGFQGGFGPHPPGVSLNSLPPLPQGYPGQIRPLTLDEYGYQGAGYAS
jgi:hypothetical protein